MLNCVCVALLNCVKPPALTTSPIFASPAWAVDDRLAQLLREAKDWKRAVTSILGLSLLKLPGLKTSSLPSIATKINPVDASGTPIYKKGWDGH